MSNSQSSQTSRPSLRSRVKEFAKRFGLTGTTLLLLAICGEIAVRLFTNTPPPLLTGDPILGRRYVRSFEGMVYNPEVKREVHLRFNRHGFRGPDRPFEKNSGLLSRLGLYSVFGDGHDYIHTHNHPIFQVAIHSVIIICSFALYIDGVI